jgi:hypothetical protein
MGSILDHPGKVSKVLLAMRSYGVANEDNTSFRYPHGNGSVRIVQKISAGERYLTVKCKQWGFVVAMSGGTVRIDSVWGDYRQIDDFLMLVLMSH